MSNEDGKTLTRRDALRGMLTVSAASVIGCGGGEAQPDAAMLGADAPVSPDAPLDPDAGADAGVDRIAVLTVVTNVVEILYSFLRHRVLKIDR